MKSPTSLLLFVASVGALLMSHTASAKDLIFQGADPSLASQHQVGCNSNTITVRSVYANLHTLSEVGVWSVLPEGACPGKGVPSANQFLTFGPYTADVADGPTQATFTLMTGTSGSGALATLDAACGGGGTILASRTIDFADFRGSYTPEDFSLNFTYTKSTQCPSLELRVLWKGGAELHHVKTVVGYPKDQILYPGDTPNISWNTLSGDAPSNPVVRFHQVGCLAADYRSWTGYSTPTGSGFCGDLEPASGAQRQSSFLTYGPYTNALGAGSHWATFTLKRTGTVNPSGYVEVYSGRTNTVLGRTNFVGTDFLTAGQEIDFTVPFTYAPDTSHQLEYRVFLTQGDLTHVKTKVSPRAPAATISCTNDAMCRSAPVACVFSYPATKETIANVPYIARRDHSKLANDYGPFGGEGSPLSGSCANPRPFCVANSCAADPVNAAASTVIDSNSFLQAGNHSPSNPERLTFNVDGAGNRNVVFAGGAQSGFRQTPYGMWAGSYDLPNTSPTGTTLTYYAKVQVRSDTVWDQVSANTPLLWLQPGVNTGYFYDVKIYRNTSNQIVLTADRCYFPGDTCARGASPWVWNLGLSDLPKTVYFSLSGGTLNLLTATGSVMTATPLSGQGSAVTLSDPLMNAPIANLDINTINNSPVTLINASWSRGFQP